jgi:hypothetical protein
VWATAEQEDSWHKPADALASMTDEQRKFIRTPEEQSALLSGIYERADQRRLAEADKFRADVAAKDERWNKALGYATATRVGEDGVARLRPVQEFAAESKANKQLDALADQSRRDAASDRTMARMNYRAMRRSIRNGDAVKPDDVEKARLSLARMSEGFIPGESVDERRKRYRAGIEENLIEPVTGVRLRPRKRVDPNSQKTYVQAT